MKVIGTRLVEGRKLRGSTVLELLMDDGSVIETTRARLNHVRRNFQRVLNAEGLARDLESLIRENNEVVARELGEIVPEEFK